jgi:hypothetical protein
VNFLLNLEGKPITYHFTFNGSGELVKREKYKPDGFDERMNPNMTK